MNDQLRVLDLFSGIGGFSLGLERAGMRTVAFCEIEPYCRAVLKKHWPDVPCFLDVRTLGAESLAGLEPIDVIAGGFPCQDISKARRGGGNAGLAGARSGLWSEMFRVISIVRPTWVVIENVDRLKNNGADRVLSDLEGIDYAGWPLVVGAGNAGAPHLRPRVWLVAHAAGERRQEIAGDVEGASSAGSRAGHASSVAEIARLPWADQSDVCRVAHGLPNRVDRIAGLGNAVVWVIPYIIARAILQAEKEVIK